MRKTEYVVTIRLPKTVPKKDIATYIKEAVTCRTKRRERWTINLI